MNKNDDFHMEELGIKETNIMLGNIKSAQSHTNYCQGVLH